MDSNNMLPSEKTTSVIQQRSPEFQSSPQQDFDTEEMRGSMQNILSQNVGEYVVIEFLIGTEQIMRKQGKSQYLIMR